MAFCKNCGEYITDGTKFCGNCGAKVENTTSGNSQRKTTFDGEIHKCPNCGEILKAFETVCPACGYEMRGTGANNIVKDLNDKLERAKSESQKISIILTYPIPNTKEDIYELFLLAYSNLDTNLYAQKLNYEDISDAWYSLIKRCYEKAKVSFGNHAEFAYIEKKYSQINTKISKDVGKLHKKESLRKHKWLIITACVLVAVILAVVIATSIANAPITVGCSENDFIGQNPEAVKNYFTNRGFTNIHISKVYVSDLQVDDGMVVDVAINNSDTYLPTDSFDKNSSIAIKYYIKPTSIGVSIEEIVAEKYDYYDFYSLLIDKGFENVHKSAVSTAISTNTNRSIKNVTINGKNTFTADELIPKNAEIIIEYYQQYKITIGKSASEIKGTNYLEVIEYLKHLGFKEEEIQLKYQSGTLVDDLFFKNNDVYAISIDSTSNFKDTATFYSDVSIVITIYTT